MQGHWQIQSRSNTGQVGYEKVPNWFQWMAYVSSTCCRIRLCTPEFSTYHFDLAFNQSWGVYLLSKHRQGRKAKWHLPRLKTDEIDSRTQCWQRDTTGGAHLWANSGIWNCAFVFLSFLSAPARIHTPLHHAACNEHTATDTCKTISHTDIWQVNEAPFKFTLREHQTNSLK